MVGIALGGLGVVSLRLPFTLWSSSIHVLDLPSVVLTICLVAFFTLIAYLTNPSEASFRAFLTELVFRQHLSRLSEAHNSIETDEPDDESSCRQSASDDEPHRIRKLSNHRSNATSSSSSDTTVPIVFHFANKASVSLRTPNYDFRSFLIVTFAVVPPVEMAMIPPIPPSSHTHHHSPSISPKLISWNNPLTRGSCFIGAFGRWWLAFEMDMQPKQVKLAAQNDATIASRLRTGDDDATVPADSSLSALSPRHEDLLFGKTAAKPQQQPAAAIPRRSSGSSRPNSKTSVARERSSIQSLPKRDPVFSTNPHPPRPTTPPPLPKSASLPLHAKRIPPPSPEQHKQSRIVSTSSPSLPACPPFVPSSSTSVSVSPPCPPSAPDQSPIIIELLEQLEATRNATFDLKAQLTQAHAVSALTTSNLEEEVARARATKKNEDMARVALKARTKSLDDARRQADSTKREAEKKLKTAESQRDHANHLIGRLGAAAKNMKREMEEEEVRVEEQRVSDAEKNVTLTAGIADRRMDLKNINSHVQVLAARARVLESAIAEEKEKFDKLKEVKDKQAKEREKEREKEKEIEDSTSSSSPLSSVWPPRLSPSEHPPGFIGPLSPAFSGLPILRPSQQLIQQIPPHTHPSGGNLSLNTSQFRPFGPEAVSPVSSILQDSSLSPISTLLIPSSLMQSIDTPPPHGQTMAESEVTSSPIDSPASSGGVIGTIYEEPFTLVEHKEAALSMPPLPSRIRFDDASIVSPSIISGNNAASKILQRPKSPSPSPLVIPSQNSATQARRRWFGINRERGLNPDAKVFTLSNQGSTFNAAIGHQDDSPIKPNLSNSNSNPMMKPMIPETGLAVGFGRTGFGHAHINSRSKIRTMTSEFGPIGSTTTTASTSPEFFHHPKSSLSAPSLQDSLFVHANHTGGHVSLRDTSSPPTRSAGAAHVVPPPPMPSFPFDSGYFSTLQNAFAPSPEERQVLFRALGGGTGSANTSREKLNAMMNSAGSGTMSMTGPLSSSGSGSSGSASVASIGAGTAAGSPSSGHRTTGSSILNPSPRGSGPIMHIPFISHGHAHPNASAAHPSHTHTAHSLSHSQTHRNAFDPWAGEGF